MYAIISTGGKQLTVKEGDVVKVEKLLGDVGTKAQFNTVLAIGGTEKPVFGSPNVPGATVSYEIVGEGRGEKVIVFKMKRRKSYRRLKGHRQDYTEIRITGIKA
ncbi:MAG: hypothetical protein RL095_1208 [Verrucomicrobiota bacterium]|jgi:large subunit ribosomal protein L21